MSTNSARSEIPTPSYKGFTNIEHRNDHPIMTPKPRNIKTAGQFFIRTLFFFGLYWYTGKIQGEQKTGACLAFWLSLNIVKIETPKNRAAINPQVTVAPQNSWKSSEKMDITRPASTMIATMMLLMIKNTLGMFQSFLIYTCS